MDGEPPDPVTTSPDNHDQGDKRRFPRTAGSLPMQYQVSNGEQWVQGTGHLWLIDVSLGGIRIRVDEPIATESQIYVHVPLPDGPIYIMARVVWMTKREDGEYVAGIEFIDLPEAERERLVKAAHEADPG